MNAINNRLFSLCTARAGPVVVEPIVPEVPVAVQEAVVVPKAGVVVPVVPKENVVPVVEKKEDVVAVAPVVPVEDVAVAGENVQDPQLLLSDPIDKATKLIIDLDDHLRKYLPAEDEVATTLAPAIAYAGGEAVAEIEPTPAERQNQMTALIDQVNRLAESIEVIIVTVYVPDDDIGSGSSSASDVNDLTEYR